MSAEDPEPGIPQSNVQVGKGVSFFQADVPEAGDNLELTPKGPLEIASLLLVIVADSRLRHGSYGLNRSKSHTLALAKISHSAQKIAAWRHPEKKSPAGLKRFFHRSSS